MSDTTKKVLLSVFIIILVAGIAFGIYWAVKNYDKVEQGLSGNNLYTVEDLENAKKEGYEEGISSLKTLESQIEDLKSKIESNALEYKNEIAIKQSRIDELNNEIDKLEQDKITLESKLNHSNANNEEYLEQINNLNEQINNLNDTISTLNSEILRLRELLNEYEIDYENQVFATYLVEGKIWKTQLYSIGDVLSFNEVPTKSYCEFVGWTIDGENVIDLSSTIINSDLVLNAKFVLLESAFSFRGLNSNGERTNNDSEIVAYALCGYGATDDTGMGPYDHPLAYFATGVDIVEVPAYFNGKPVIEIGNNAFSCYAKKGVGYDIKQIILPNTIVKIGSNAFSHTSAEIINIPDSVLEIYFGAFSCASNIKSLSVPNSVVYLGRSNVFAGMSSLIEIDFNANVEIIPQQTFDRCKNLKSIEIPSSVVEIEENAFRDCSSLSSIKFNEGITTIGNYAFRNCPIYQLTIPTTLREFGTYCFDYSRGYSLDVRIEGNEVLTNMPVLFRDMTLRGSCGNLYVDASLIETYKTYSSSWAKSFDQILSLDDCYFN